MARTPEGRALVIRHSRQQLAVRNAAVRDMRSLWRGVDPTNLSRTIHPFAEGASTIVAARHQQSASVASGFYQAFRRIEGTAGVITLGPINPPRRFVTTSVLRGAALAGILRARRAGFPIAAASQAGFVRASGSASNVVLSGGRDVLMVAMQSDPQATGRYGRVLGPGENCDFCQMLVDRGPVYTARTGGFEAHDHCACGVEPELRPPVLGALAQSALAEVTDRTGTADA